MAVEDASQGTTGRRRAIADLVAIKGFVRITEIATRFEVSTVTARSDVDRLAERGIVRRVRGGAMASRWLRSERPLEETTSAQAAEKAAVADAAAQLVESSSTVILDVGTTTTAIARALAQRDGLTDVTVVTSGLTVAMELEPQIPRFTVILTGGTLRPLQHSLVDPLADLLLDRLHADLAIISCNGVDPAAGITNVNLPEVAVKQRMLAAARRRVVVADGSKIGAVSRARICQLSDVDLLITDSTAPPDVLDDLSAGETELTVAELPDWAAPGDAV